MSTTRDDLRDALALHDPRTLRAVLVAAGVRDGAADSTAGQLAERIARAVWWHSSTPLGFAAGKADLETIVQRVAKRLGVQHRVLASDDAWSQLESLTRALVASLPAQPGVALSDLDPSTRKRMGAHWKRAVAFGGGAGGSMASHWASGAVLGFLEGPIGRLLPLLPPVAPWVGTVRTGASTIRAVSGPLGVAFAVLSANQALGPDYKKLVPLLLGIGALGPQAVAEADVVDAAV